MKTIFMLLGLMFYALMLAAVVELGRRLYAAVDSGTLAFVALCLFVAAVAAIGIGGERAHGEG